MVKITLIDDEVDSRELLRDIINQYPDCQIIGEAGNTAQAIELLQNTNPDIVFLDIDLKDGTGFDVLKSCQESDFNIVFVTAFNDFAIKAFKFNALDYLLKPVLPSDIYNIIQKIRTQQFKNTIIHNQLQNLICSINSRKNEKLILNTAESTFFIPLEEITFLKSDGNYTTIFTIKCERIIVSKNIGSFDYLTMSNMADGESTFFKIHQSYIVNLRFIRQLVHLGDGDFVILDNEIKVPISRRRKEEIFELLTKKTVGR